MIYFAGQWIWSDQSESEYELWGPGEPAEWLQKQDEACGYLNYNNDVSLEYGELFVGLDGKPF